ncbi:Netrin-4 Precursor [Triplophysa tibetana]|uniref:Netrin-4 n=1 Tax=Triplophysa tibetana TaxID=1572043 RepID=A0A5A9PPS2_9TELE|nr:Netrin-4 Precursor [Triplophysa tibetana]
MGNLAVGRPVRTISQCGLKAPERYCHYTMDKCVPNCEVCDASVTHLAHPPASMTDSPFKHPQTWWQSAQGITIETLQLDLEVEFYFTHLIIIFRSPRPGAMAIERSQDFGHTWSALRLYAHNCSEVFNLEDEHRCTEKYSTALPCSNGEVIYRALSPWDKLDPYSNTAQAHLSITNIRVHLLQPQSCPCQHKFPDANFSTPHYAIYDLISKGGCLCHGHADYCVPAGDPQIKDLPNKHMVHGKCVCRHHTAGDHCEKCDRLYNDQPWKPANGLTGQAHQCVKVAVYVTVFTTPVDATVNIARAAFTETQSDRRLNRIRAHHVCVTDLVPHSVTLIMETVSVSQAWLGHTVTIAGWDSGALMNMAVNPASVPVTVTLTQETA